MTAMRTLGRLCFRAFVLASLALPAWALRVEGSAAPAAQSPSATFISATPGPFSVREVPLVAAKVASAAADNSRRVQLGVTLELPRALASSDIQWRKAADGRYAGYLRVRSQGAGGMRIYLELPRTAPSFEARFRAAGSGTAAFVALRGRSVEEGGLWSPVVPGDTIEAEILLSEPPSRARQAFTVTRASALTKPLAAAEKAIGSAGACERDVKCYSLTSAALNNAKATALLLVTTSSGTFGCTGTLLNTSTSSHVPYVLTDADCVTSQADASTLNALWDYQATACGSNTAQSFTRTSAGATLLVRDAGRHFSFVQLSEAAPATRTRTRLPRSTRY
jgi:lysyl endopeptidase